MKEYVLKIDGLTKEYKNTRALDNVSISIEKGKIYGFIGQNGAGKTTLMRIVAGLSFPSEGTIELFGSSDSKEIAKQRKRMGCMIETPALYSYMTAYENMEAVRIGRGIPNKESINKALSMVNLQDTGKKKVKDFSLGMKQRLGIAMALLGEPEFLMLDEPTNGIDPISMIEIRELLIRLSRDGQITVLISSHILSELHQVVTDYVFIHNGKIIEKITKESLDERCKKHIAFKVDDAPFAITVIEEKLNTKKYKVMPDNTIILYDYVDEIHRVISILLENKLVISNINVSDDSLESYFIDILGGEINV